MQKYRRWAIAAIMIISFGMASGQTAALYGGQQTYGSCTYGNDCSSNSSPSGGSDSGSNSGGATASTTDVGTVVQLPSGLQVSINLHDGQLIPRSGYTIVVTPLNGRGTSFKQVVITIESNPAISTLPGQTGTATWLWLPTQMPGTHVTVVVIGQDGQTITQHYTIRLTNARFVAPAGASAALPTSGLSGSIGHFLRTWPKPLVLVFPYLLFILLALNIGVLFAQTSRELHELRAARRRTQRMRQIDSMKRTFTELASHYLRTPLTLIQGGLEEYGARSPAAVAAQNSTQQLQTTIAALIEDARQRDAAVEQSFERIRSLPVVSFVPLIAAAVLAFAFDYLASHTAGIAIGKTSIVLQAVICALLAVLLYVAARVGQLRRRDRRAAHTLLASGTRLAQAHEQFVRETLQRLDADVQRLSAAVGALDAGQARTFVEDGVQRLKTLLAKFAIAGQLRGTKSSAPFATVALRDVLQRAWQPLASAASTKGVTLDTIPDVSFGCQGVQLFTLVWNHLLDNAVAYAPPQTHVTVASKRLDKHWAFSITNAGEAISPEKLAILFEPFAKSEGAETFNHEGMGFSLYLDRLIVAYFGGVLKITSRANVGTTVTMILPLPDTAQDVQAPARGTRTSQMPWPSAASTAQAAPMVDLDDVN